MWLKLSTLFCFLFGVTNGMLADLYLNKDKFGEYFKLEINEKGCTNVPLNWENQAVSVDTHGSCIKLYDLPYCRGKYVALQPYHGTFQDNLNTLGFSKVVSSASPCGPKVPTGRYYIQNGADGSVLTIETRNQTPVARAHAFKPYISKGQQFQVERVSLADYEIIPRVHQNLNPVTYDLSISKSSSPVRRTWKIESVYRGRYIIKNEWSNRCLYKADNGKVEEHECVAWSPNQEWIFRSIKVKPYFPSKEDLKKKPLRPDDDFPFEPLDDAFSPVPYNPLSSFRPPSPDGGSKKQQKGGDKKGKKPVQIQRPGPLVINPGEPFPPVLPYPILPQNNGGGGKNKPQGSPPVPQIRHPGPLPFPVEPIIKDVNSLIYSPFDTFDLFRNNGTSKDVKKNNKNKEQDDKKSEEISEEKNSKSDETKSEEEEDDLDDSSHEGDDNDGSDEGRRRPGHGKRPRPRPHQRPGPPGPSKKSVVKYSDYRLRY